MYRLTVAYPAKPGGTFDFTYYRDTHMPLVRAGLGANVIKTEIAKGVSGGGNAAAPYTCIGTVYFKSLEEFGKGMAQHGASFMNDVANYTNITPTVQVEEMVD